MPDSTPDPTPGSTPDRSGTTGRSRLRRALAHPRRRQLVVALLLGVLGFAAVAQVQSNQLENSYAGYREQDLIDVLTGLSVSSQRAEREVERLEDTRDELLSDASAREAATEQARSEAESLAILAGSVPVNGPGLRIRIEEPEGQIRVDTLLDTIQALRTGGAEAIEFHGEVRVVAQTAIEDAVGGITVDGRRLEAPYVIDVIGEPHTLAGSLTFIRGPVELAQSDGARMTFEELDSVDIETTRDAARPDYASPQQDE